MLDAHAPLPVLFVGCWVSRIKTPSGMDFATNPLQRCGVSATHL
jgi:hypothetical protein